MFWCIVEFVGGRRSEVGVGGKKGDRVVTFRCVARKQTSMLYRYTSINCNIKKIRNGTFWFLTDVRGRRVLNPKGSIMEPFGFIAGKFAWWVCSKWFHNGTFWICARKGLKSNGGYVS